MTDYFEEHARMERCGDEATSLFMIICKSARADFNSTMANAVDPPNSPRWERAREAARKKFKLVSEPAWDLRELALRDLMAFGEVSRAVDDAMTKLRDAQIKAATLEEV